MKKFYVVGNRASKSLSPTIFNYWFKKYKVKAKYSFLELNNLNFDKKIKEVIKNKNVGGLNITIPFKKKIIKHIDKLDKHSKIIKAVNCVSTRPRVIGINTDWKGYYKSLPNIKNIKNKKVVLIGYGGAALSIHYVLKKKGIKKITVFNRTKKKLSFEKRNKHTLSLKKLDKYLPSADLIINTTPLNPIKQKNKTLINKKSILSDLIYKPKETNFLKSFPNNEKVYGISMLLEQAVPCFKLWFGFKPTIDSKLLKVLEQKLK